MKLIIEKDSKTNNLVYTCPELNVAEYIDTETGQGWGLLHEFSVPEILLEYIKSKVNNKEALSSIRINEEKYYIQLSFNAKDYFWKVTIPNQAYPIEAQEILLKFISDVNSHMARYITRVELT